MDWEYVFLGGFLWIDDWNINQQSGWSTWCRSVMFRHSRIPEWWVCESPGLFPCPSPFAWSIIEWPFGMGCQTKARGWETPQHLGTDVHCNQDFARQDDAHQSIVADSHLEPVRTSYLYSERCFKWVSSIINANFVRPDWASSKAFNVLLGPLLDVAGYAFAAAAVLAPFSGFNIVTGMKKSKGGKNCFGKKWCTNYCNCNYLWKIVFLLTRMTRTIRVHVSAPIL